MGGLGVGVGGVTVRVLGMGTALLLILCHMMLCAAMVSYVVLRCAATQGEAKGPPSQKPSPEGPPATLGYDQRRRRAHPEG